MATETKELVTLAAYFDNHSVIVYAIYEEDRIHVEDQLEIEWLGEPDFSEIYGD